MDGRLATVFKRVFRVDEIGPESSPETILGWDSLAHLALVSELEREFDVEFSADDVIAMVNVRIIGEILAERGVLGRRVTGNDPDAGQVWGDGAGR